MSGDQEAAAATKLAERIKYLDDRNRELENVCQALWPYVQHFGLCGAHPQATATVARLAHLLGQAQPPLPPGALEKAMHAARVAEHEQSSIWLRANINAARHGAILDRFDQELAPGD